jgi:hypothetical protein
MKMIKSVSLILVNFQHNTGTTRIVDLYYIQAEWRNKWHSWANNMHVLLVSLDVEQDVPTLGTHHAHKHLQYTHAQLCTRHIETLSSLFLLHRSITIEHHLHDTAHVRYIVNCFLVVFLLCRSSETGSADIICFSARPRVLGTRLYTV